MKEVCNDATSCAIPAWTPRNQQKISGNFSFAMVQYATEAYKGCYGDKRT